MKMKIPRSQAKIVTDEEMQTLIIEAASKHFYNQIAHSSQNTSPTNTNDDSTHGQASELLKSKTPID
jgi:hypothetical protein